MTKYWQVQYIDKYVLLLLQLLMIMHIVKQNVYISTKYSRSERTNASLRIITIQKVSFLQWKCCRLERVISTMHVKQIRTCIFYHASAVDLNVSFLHASADQDVSFIPCSKCAVYQDVSFLLCKCSRLGRVFSTSPAAHTAMSTLQSREERVSALPFGLKK